MSVHPSPHTNATAQSPTQRRHEQLHEAFFVSVDKVVEVGRQEQPGLINIIASYDDKNPPSEHLARQNTLAKTVEVLAAQMRYLPARVRENFHLVIADNGMSVSQTAAIRATVDSINNTLRQGGEPEIALHIAHAPKNPSNPLTATAAYARNKALSLVKEKRRDDPRFGASVWIGDDDSITLGMAPLYKVLTSGSGRIGAVAPQNRSTADVIVKANAVLGELQAGQHTPPQHATFRGFPGITDPEGTINFCLLTAFGGTRVPKTCSLMLDGNAVQSMQRGTGEVFLVCPEGSFEDMLLSGRLERGGYELVECGQAEVFDQVRIDPKSRGLQQFRWAFDHATAYHDFISLGRATKQSLVYEGVTVLTKAHDQWLLSRIPSKEPSITRPLHTNGVHAAIVNPSEVLELLGRIEISLAHDPEAFIEQHPYAFKGRLGSFEDVEVLKQTVSLCTSLLHNIAPIMPNVQRELVHVPVTRVGELNGPDQLRFEVDVRVARILGNLAAIASMSSNDIEAGRLGVALLGPRQPTR